MNEAPDETIYIHLTSTGEGMPTGTWRAGEEEPPKTVAAIGSPAAVAAVRAWADRLDAAEARVAELESAINDSALARRVAKLEGALANFVRLILKQEVTP